MVTNSKKYFIDKIRIELEKIGLHPLVKYDRISRCYKVRLRRRDEIRLLFKKAKAKTSGKGIPETSTIIK